MSTRITSAIGLTVAIVFLGVIAFGIILLAIGSFK